MNGPARAFSWPIAVLVKLVDVAPLAGALRFEMLSEPKPLPGVKRSFHKAKCAHVAAHAASQACDPARDFAQRDPTEPARFRSFPEDQR